MRRVNRSFNIAAAIVLAVTAIWLAAGALNRRQLHVQAARDAAIAQARRDAERVSAEAARRASLIKPHVSQRIERGEGMPSQGPFVVNSATDGGEDPSGNWTNPNNATSTSNAAVAVATAGVATSLNTNTLKCQINNGDFTIDGADTITGIIIRFRAWSSNGMGSPIVNVSSVKTSITTGDAADGATLTAVDTQYTYTISESPPTANVDIAWEIDLVFSSPTSSDFGDVNLYDVTAEVFYTTSGGTGTLGTVVPADWLLTPTLDAGASSAAIAGRAKYLRNPIPAEVSADQSRQAGPVAMLAAETPHAEMFAKMFVPRGPDRWRMYWLPMMGAYDPTMLTLPNAPEPIHPENYPPVACLPNPRPRPQAWQFPAMASTDFTGLLSGESAHPEITRQLAVEVPPRQPMRQYQPPMGNLDPGALALNEAPAAFDRKPPDLPPRQHRRIVAPPIDNSYFIPASPGDPSIYPLSFAMVTPQRAFVLERRQPTVERLALDTWSQTQFVQPSMAVPLRGPHKPRQLPIQAADTAPQYFEDQQIIGWQVPLGVPVRRRAPAQNMQPAGEVAGETFDLALVEPSAWGPNAPAVALLRPRGKTPPLETLVEDVRSIADVDGWQSASLMPNAAQRGRSPRNESLLPFTEITSANTEFLASMAPPVVPQRKPVRGRPMETELIPPTGTGTYPIADYVLPMSTPLFGVKPIRQRPVGSFFHQDDTLQTIPDLAPMAVIPQPVPRRLQASGFEPPRDELTVLLVSHWQQPLSLPVKMQPQPVRLPSETAVYDNSALSPPVTAIGPMRSLPPRKPPTNAVLAAPNIPLPLDPLNVASDFLAMPVEQRRLQPAQPNVIQLVIQPDAAPTPAIVKPMETRRPGEKLQAAQPTPLRFQTDQQYFGEVVMSASYEPTRQALPVRRKPLPQAIADPLTEAPTSFQVLAGLDGMVALPLRAKPRQQPKEHATPTPPLANIHGGLEPMDASAALRRRRTTPQVHSPLPIDQQFFAEAIKPASYEASWFLPRPRPRSFVQPIESASTTMYLAGGNPATFAGSGAFVVVAGAVYSLSPVAGKVTGADRGI